MAASSWPGCISTMRHSAVLSGSSPVTTASTSRSSKGLTSSSTISDVFDELQDERLHVLRRIHELDAGAVCQELLIDVDDPAVCDPPFEHGRLVAKHQAQLVERIDLQGRRRFDLRSSAADLADHHRLEKHDLAAELDGEPLSITGSFLRLTTVAGVHRAGLYHGQFMGRRHHGDRPGAFVELEHGEH